MENYCLLLIKGNKRRIRVVVPLSLIAIIDKFRFIPQIYIIIS